MTTPNVPNRPCAIDFAGNVWNQREYGDRDTPATAIPNERFRELEAADRRATDAEALLREADSWLSLAAHRLASETPKVGEPSRADILAMCAKIAAFLASKGATT